MDTSNKIQVKIGQKQTLNQKLLASIGLLSMSNLELSEHINDLSTKNVFIEPVTINYENALSGKMPISTDYNIDDFIPDKKSIYDYLVGQVLLEKMDEKIYEIAKMIIYNLNSDGYFLENHDDFIEKMSLDKNDFKRALKTVQSLSPRGIASNSLRDFLLIQAKSDEEKLVIRDYFEDFLKNRADLVSKKSTLSLKEVSMAFEKIRSLDIKPINSLEIAQKSGQLINPDYIVTFDENDFSIKSNMSPHVKINAEYVEILNNADPATKKFLSPYYDQARLIANAVREREKNIKRVLDFLIHYNISFFMHNGSIEALSMRELADELSLSESTISRIANNKYIATKKGLLPLKFFFSKAVPSKNGPISRMSVEKKILSYIKLENKEKPLSDAKICQKLNEDGIDIKRRTVTKYRKALNIENSSLRKIWG